MTDPMHLKIAKAVVDAGVLRGFHTGRQGLLDELTPVIAEAMGARTLADSCHHAEVSAGLFDQVVGDLMKLAQNNYDQVATEEKIRDALGKSLTPKHDLPDPDLVNVLRALDGSRELVLGPVTRAVLQQYIVRLQDAVLAADGQADAARSLIAAVADEIRLIEGRRGCR